jgi:hypothetical protein
MQFSPINATETRSSLLPLRSDPPGPPPAPRRPSRSISPRIPGRSRPPGWRAQERVEGPLTRTNGPTTGAASALRYENLRTLNAREGALRSLLAPLEPAKLSSVARLICPLWSRGDGDYFGGQIHSSALTAANWANVFLAPVKTTQDNFIFHSSCWT